MRKSDPKNLSSFDIWLVQLPFPLSLSLIYSRYILPFFISFSPCHLSFSLMPAWLTSWRATTHLDKCRRLSGISGTSSGIPYRRVVRNRRLRQRGYLATAVGRTEKRKRKTEETKERWGKVSREEGKETPVTAKLLSIHGRHAPNWEYAPGSCSTRTDAAWMCWDRNWYLGIVVVFPFLAHGRDQPRSSARGFFHLSNQTSTNSDVLVTPLINGNYSLRIEKLCVSFSIRNAIELHARV